jgi:hypothetical protein
MSRRPRRKVGRALACNRTLDADARALLHLNRKLAAHSAHFLARIHVHC